MMTILMTISMSPPGFRSRRSAPTHLNLDIATCASRKTTSQITLGRMRRRTKNCDSSLRGAFRGDSNSSAADFGVPPGGG